jgi:plastocyanin
MRVALLALFAVLALTACGSSSSESGTTGQAAGGQAVAISETEFKLDPSSVQVDPAGTVTFRVTNDGAVDHALEVDGQGVEEETETIKPGESAELTVDLSKEGSYEIYCPIGNHRDMGMEGTLTVGAAMGGGSTGTGSTGTTEDEGSTTSGDDGYGYGSG